MSSEIAYRNDGGPWYAKDAAMAEHVDLAIKEGRAVKFLRPDTTSADGKWEAVGSGFHIWADSYGEMCETLRKVLGIAPAAVDAADSPAAQA